MTVGESNGNYVLGNVNMSDLMVSTNCHAFLGHFWQYIINTMLRSIGHNVQNT
jgi:hypothetical protein